MTLKFFALSLLILTLNGCSALKQMAIDSTCQDTAAYQTGQNDATRGQQPQTNYASICPANANQYNQQYLKGYRSLFCSNDRAYAAGVNDGKSNQDMRVNYAAVCSANQRKAFNQQYRQGYKFGLEQYSHKVNINIGQTHSDSGSQYSCLDCRDSFQRNCGYDCMKNDAGHVLCGASAQDRCIRGKDGDVVCGSQCSLDSFGEASCQRQSYSKDSERNDSSGFSINFN
ncbi:hypothetical protein [Dongshaea marina]|uniref:hypothetical protein n=1 Tax=Dongshaea marina TaxID=2047966 RepID=UPI000D3E8440|nr:hypothetical protein [Dongshaea marina]